MVDNRLRDNHGVVIQAGAIHGPVTVNFPATPTPEWVDGAQLIQQSNIGKLGVHHALPGSDGAELPPYVARDVDGELDERLAAVAAAPRGGLVLVTGASTAGKTRALAAALGRTLPDRMLVAPPEDADLRPLPGWLKERAAQAPRGWVVWLDDLDRHLGASGLTPALVSGLGQVGAVVAATIRREHLEALRPSTTAAEGMGYAVLKTPPVIVERLWNPQERERARASGDERLIGAADDTRFGVAEQLAAGPLLRQTWRSGPESGHPRGYAMVAAAVGLAEAGVSGALTREQIQAAHVAYLPAPPPLPEEADRAWAWAVHQRSGLAGLLVPVDHEGRRWRAFDYLTTQGPLPATVWRTALDIASDQDLLAVGLTANKAELYDVAEEAFLRSAKQGDDEAMFNLASLLKETGRAREAKAWYRRAAGLDHDYAILALGLMFREEGRAKKAEAWFRRGAELGQLESMFVLGITLTDRGRIREAVPWFQRAAELGNTGSMVTLGVLAQNEKKWTVAETWFRQAADRGDSEAVEYLTELWQETGRPAEIEIWYRQAAERGDLGSMVELGHLLEDAGRLTEAESWFRRAAERDDLDAMNFLGYLLEDVGRPTEAETWYRKAAERNSPSAITSLGALAEGAGRLTEAEDRYRKAAGQGYAPAVHCLGILAENAGLLAEAEAWYRKAAEQEYAPAMTGLANLLRSTGRPGEAEAWRQRAS